VQQWEYTVRDCWKDPDRGWVVSGVDKMLEHGEALSSLGREGWELVAIQQGYVATGRDNRIQPVPSLYVFKRPASGE
jgi:hypothetical protein